MIFLSASIPDPKRNPIYFNTADIVAIRDSVRALATVIIPKTKLIWGGHPAITPLIRFVMQTMGSDVQEHVTLYQSDFFRKQFPTDNKFIESLVVTEDMGNQEESLRVMRKRMIGGHKFKAGLFIGGMEGVEDEYTLFKETHPNAVLLPLASTGAAAKIIFESERPRPDNRLLTDYAYMSLFKSLLKEYI